MNLEIQQSKCKVKTYSMKSSNTSDLLLTMAKQCFCQEIIKLISAPHFVPKNKLFLKRKFHK